VGVEISPRSGAGAGAVLGELGVDGGGGLGSANAWRCSAATARGKVQKFAEIVAATVLCGELSLGSAVVAEVGPGA